MLGWCGYCRDGDTPSGVSLATGRVVVALSADVHFLLAQTITGRQRRFSPATLWMMVPPTGLRTEFHQGPTAGGLLAANTSTAEVTTVWTVGTMTPMSELILLCRMNLSFSGSSQHLSALQRRGVARQ